MTSSRSLFLMFTEDTSYSYLLLRTTNLVIPKVCLIVLYIIVLYLINMNMQPTMLEPKIMIFNLDETCEYDYL